MGRPEGDPVWPGRSGAVRTMVIDEGDLDIAGKGPSSRAAPTTPTTT